MGEKLKNLKELNKDMDRMLLAKITVSPGEKNKILQSIQGRKKRNSLRYYAALVTAAALVCLITLSQLDFLQKNEPGMSDDSTPLVVPEDKEPAETPEVMEETPEVVEDEEDTLESPEVEEETPEVPEEKEEETVVPEVEIPALVDNIIEDIIQTYYDLGIKYNWNNMNGNPADFEILKPELRKYASESMTEGKLKEITPFFYTPRDGTFIPARGFDIRYIIKENTPNKIVITTIGLEDYISQAETVYYTLIKEDDKWVLDDWRRIGTEEEPLHITLEEFKASRETWGSDFVFLEEVTHNGEKIYVYKLENGPSVEAVYASTSKLIYGPLDEWIPEEYR